MTHRSEGFCDQSSYELIRECRSAVNDLFTAMCQELDEREALTGEHNLVSHLELALDELCAAQVEVEQNKVEELVWPKSPVEQDDGEGQN
jgi:hypothetical protein